MKTLAKFLHTKIHAWTKDRKWSWQVDHEVCYFSMVNRHIVTVSIRLLGFCYCRKEMEAQLPSVHMKPVVVIIYIKC